jgi:DNA-binding transcriptional ArsR family regulator
VHLFAVLADPVRRLIVETLASGEHTVAELTDMAMFDFGIGRTAVSHHLRILRDEHVVLARQDTASRMYRLHPGVMDRLDREVDSLRVRWESRTGWPYLTEPILPARAHRPDRSNRRGRGRIDDVWQRPQARDPDLDRQRPWLADPIDDEGDGEHRWAAEGATPRPRGLFD